MRRMNLRSALAATFGVWALAFASAGALAYQLNRPLVPANGVEQTTAATSAIDSRLTVAPSLELRPVIHVPTMTMAVATPRPQVHEPKLPDITQMKCADWRPLQMGSGNVQICE